MAKNAIFLIFLAFKAFYLNEFFVVLDVIFMRFPKMILVYQGKMSVRISGLKKWLKTMKNGKNRNF